MFTVNRTALSGITPPVGNVQRQASRLLNAVQTHYVDLIVSATFTITGAIDAIRNRGSVMAIFDEFGLDESGRDRWQVDARSLGYYAETFAPSALTKTRLTTLGIQVLTLREHIRIPLAHPYAANPRETAYLERDTRQILQLFARQAADPFARLASGGAGTVTNVRVDVVQEYDKLEQGRPFFLPVARQITLPVNAGSTRLPLDIRTSNFVRSILIQQDTASGGEVSDIINGLVLRGDLRDIIGPTPVPFSALVRASEYEFGGAVGPAAGAGNGSYLLLNFQRFGRLSSVLNPAHDVNLRFEFDAQPSVVAGSGASSIRLTMFELEHDAGAVDVNGRRLVQPINFPI